MFHSAHVLVLYNNAVLLVKRRDIPIWVIPGGWAEQGEQPIQTAQRELFEESGVKLSARDLHLAVHYSPVKSGARAKYTFVARLTVKPALRTSNESSEVGFFPLSHLPEPITVYETKRIHDAFSHRKEMPVESIDRVVYSQEFLKFVKTPRRFLSLLYTAFQFRKHE